MIKRIMKNLQKLYQKDLEFLKRTEEAYERHKNGDFIEMRDDEFLKELKKW